MTILEAILILILIYGFLAFLWVFMLYWFYKNSISVKISQYIDGSFQVFGGRYRLVKVNKYKKHDKWYKNFKPTFMEKPLSTKYKLFSIKDIFRRNPLSISYEEYKNKFISSEGFPIIGIKKVLRLKRLTITDRLMVWNAPEKQIDKDAEIKDTIMAWVTGTRRELYESTKREMTKQDMIMKIYLPTVLGIVAVAMLIFFPKIYQSIMEHGGAPITGLKTAFNDFLGQFRPPG